jgi:hypothetical protein
MCCHIFFCSHKFHKIEDYLIFEMLNKKLNFLPKYLSLTLTSQKYGFGIRDPEKTYSGSRIRVQGSKRHQIPDPGSATVIHVAGTYLFCSSLINGLSTHFANSAV